MIGECNTVVMVYSLKHCGISFSPNSNSIRSALPPCLHASAGKIWRMFSIHGDQGSFFEGFQAVVCAPGHNKDKLEKPIKPEDGR